MWKKYTASQLNMNKIKKQTWKKNVKRVGKVLQQTAQGDFRRFQLDCPHGQARQETINNETSVFDPSTDKKQ